MSRLASWQPPRLGKIVLVLIPAAIVILIVAGILHTAPPQGKTSSAQSTRSVPNTPSGSASVVVSSPPTSRSNNPTDLTTVGTINLDPATVSNITAAVRTWAAYPNQKGKAATLAQLRRNLSVAPEALTDVARQWAKPTRNLISVTVEGVYIENLPSFVSAAQATLNGTVTQGQLYNDGKTTHARINVVIQLKKEGAAWRISQLTAP